MTAVIEPEETVMIAGPKDTEIAIKNALRRAGCTFDELAEQARTGQFRSLRARLAWVAIGGYYKA
ncbi:hypothetical protein IU459_11795 [Nocardia amamiensis]|uniref:Uncharacterized protein n=1 Tax=Nocardia amamiensis TaxID=404578 RepID=A0ABS0CNJ1_9NOCA|nr:hypothetical protein [Nocardia amamiensis]MBF6298223.1 hypothetical protein [Nocardia amamiensis]